MPKRKLNKPNDVTLSAIKDARKRGIPLTEEQARMIQGSTYKLTTQGLPFGAIADAGKYGEPRFWTPDQPKGPGLTELPLSRKLREMERDWEVQAVKRDQRPPVEAATSARIARSKRGAIEQAWREIGLESRHAAKRIAQQLGVGHAYVNKVRAEMRLTESA